MAEVPILNSNDWWQTQTKAMSGRSYFAFYSSITRAITRDPACMVIPIDDHMVHRGDGVFEALRFFNRGIYDVDAHLERLAQSAAALGLALPKPLGEIKALMQATAKAADRDEGIVRLFVSRGPGSFSVSPRDTAGAQLYIVVTALQSPSVEKYHQGVTARVALTEAKLPFYARVKSCNYLPNVLTKAEALDAGVDFAINVDRDGLVTEGPTENLMVVTQKGELVAPDFDRTLRGTTLMRVFSLAEGLKAQGKLSWIGTRALTVDDLQGAKEMAMVGTTLGVLPVREFEGQQFEEPFVTCHSLRQHLLTDQESNPALRTVF